MTEYEAPQEAKKSNTTRNIIIAVVVLAFLCCCCMIALYGGWTTFEAGDFMSEFGNELNF